jgi:pseudouridine-5'-phosphate glycosidase
MNRNKIKINPEVENALATNQAVVALESTIISHGMPNPTNIETALEVERIIRNEGAIPATMGIIEGEIICGLTEDDIRFFGTGKNIVKATERDIPLVISRKQNAATTVGTSLAIAASTGITVLVTGGIGAVAPEAGTNFDISADLKAIEEYPCITVCAGVKAFMDIPATLEYFETHRILVGSYQSTNFPYFYSRDSRQPVDWVIENIEEIVAVYRNKRDFDFKGGILIGVPLPEGSALPETETKEAVEYALKQGRLKQLHGKALTPFLLDAIKTKTDGRSLEANIALIKHNAEIGARIAVGIIGK